MGVEKPETERLRQQFHYSLVHIIIGKIQAATSKTFSSVEQLIVLVQFFSISPQGLQGMPSMATIVGPLLFLSQ